MLEATRLHDLFAPVVAVVAEVAEDSAYLERAKPRTLVKYKAYNENTNINWK